MPLFQMAYLDLPEAMATNRNFELTGAFTVGAFDEPSEAAA